MNNISKVLDHIHRINPMESFQNLHIVPTRNGNLIYQDNTGKYYRLYNYLSHTESMDRVTHGGQARGGARAFGQFIQLLTGLDPKELYITIPDFHNLKIRFSQLQRSISLDRVGRSAQCKNEIEFVLGREALVRKYSDLMDHPQVPFRVVHNDTKINNVLFKAGTNKGICIVDLDTVMTGLLLFDFGDMARTFCSNALEDETGHEVLFRLNIFEPMCEGFFSGLKTPPKKMEIESLKTGPWWMTGIMGIRFLTDFLSGDIYYKIDYPNQNLERARNQLDLLKDIELKQPQIEAIIDARFK